MLLLHIHSCSLYIIQTNQKYNKAYNFGILIPNVEFEDVEPNYRWIQGSTLTWRVDQAPLPMWASFCYKKES